MIEHDLTNVPDLNSCIKYDGCSGFDRLVGFKNVKYFRPDPERVEYIELT